MFRALLDRPIIRRRLAALGGVDDLTGAQVARLAWLALLHDIGKLNRGFQELRGQGHVQPVEALFLPKLQGRTMAALRWSAMEGWVADPLTLRGLFIASISHHGTPAQLDTGNTRHFCLWQPNDRLDPMSGLDRLIDAAMPHFTEAFATGGPLLPDRPAFQHGFAGLVSLADWIGSDEEFFPYTEPGDPDRWSFACQRAAEVLTRIGMAPDAARRALGQREPFAAMGLGAVPNATQQAVAALPAGAGPTVALVEAPTGSGKTEAALARFLALFAAGEVDGLYFALPTRAAAVQIHGRVRDAARHAFGFDDAPPVLLAVPGYIRVDDAQGRLLPGFEVQWPDRPDMATRGWAAENPKRYLAGAIVVGTIDQALMSALRVRHAHLRGAALTRHLLVVDEVHASDPYMRALLGQLMAAMSEAHGHVLLMSATLGSVARSRLLGEPLPPPEEAGDVPYPAVVLRAGTAPPVAEYPERSGGKQVSVTAAPILGDPAVVAARALAAARAGGRVLVLRNTVRAAIATQQALEAEAGDSDLLFRCAGQAAPHHSRFARDDRQRLDAQVEAAFGKDSSMPVVLVATQTVEQSLDIDADLLLTDLCPADVLLQRIGRLHRHRRTRPDAFAEARCVVLTPAERDLTPYLARGRDGFGLRRAEPLAYPDLRAIEATWRLVETLPTWDLPAMNRRLVEAATHPARLEAIAAGYGGGWRDHQQILQAIEFGQQSIARLNALNRTIPFDDDENAFGDLEGRISTRLGADDRTVAFAEPPPGPFGQPVHVLSIPGWMALGVPGDADPRITGREPLRFRLGDRRYLYDRLGLRSDTDGGGQ